MVMLLLLAFGLTAATVTIHALGTLEVIMFLDRARERQKRPLGLLISGIQIVRVVSVLLLFHLIEAGVWASVYRISDILPDFETAIYFSITSYTTVGYGDVVLTAPWRLLGPIEAGVGILMFGWSTGIMVAAITRIHDDRFKVRSGEQEIEEG